jgi:hypothetical protein
MAADKGPVDAKQMTSTEMKMGTGNHPAPDGDEDSERNALSHCLYPSLQKFENAEPLPLNHQCEIDRSFERFQIRLLRHGKRKRRFNRRLACELSVAIHIFKHHLNPNPAAGKYHFGSNQSW